MKKICYAATGLLLLSLSSCRSRTETGETSPQPRVTSSEPEREVSGDHSRNVADASSLTQDLPAVTVSRETTWVLEPLDERGRIDFVAAVNRQGPPVQAEQNAALALVQILGSGFEEEEFHREFVRHLGGELRIAMHTHSLISQSEFARRQNIDPPDTFFESCGTASSRPWTAGEFPRVDRWLKSCQSDLDKCVNATQRSKYFYPLIAALDEESAKYTSALAGVLLPLPQSCRDIARALTARAMLHTGNGDIESASQDLLAACRLGRLVAQGPTLIEFLIGTAIESMAYEGVIGLINSGKLDAQGTTSLRMELTNLPSAAALQEKLQMGERLMALDMAVAMADNGPGVLAMVSSVDVSNADLDASSVDWDTALRTINQWYDRLGEALNEPTFSQRVAAVEGLNESMKQIAKGDALNIARLLQGGASDAARSGQQLGNFIAALTVPGGVAAHVAETRCRSQYEMALLALRLHQFRLDNGKLPETLEAVGSDGLIDRFTGQPLVYRCRDGSCLLYATGANQGDDGGPLSADRDSSDDVGYQLVNTDK